MQVWNVSLDECAQIARELDLRLERPKQVNGRCVSFSIRRNSKESPYRKHGYSTRNDGTPRTAGSAVCWHGHRDFLMALFCAHRDARVRSSFADYRGYADFEEKFDETYYHNVGSVMRPRYAGEMCDCED